MDEKTRFRWNMMSSQYERVEKQLALLHPDQIPGLSEAVRADLLDRWRKVSDILVSDRMKGIDALYFKDMDSGRDNNEVSTFRQLRVPAGQPDDVQLTTVSRIG